MAEHVRQVKETTTQVSDDTVQTRRVEREPTARAAAGQRTLTNLIWLIAGIILILLGLRFVLALLGANLGNGFAHFIFSASHPFVAPFFSLFSYNYSYGVSRVEFYTLFAMLIYAVVAWILTSLVNLNRR
jgi:YggT family protein